MFCSNCGQELPQGSKFCMSCGKSLSENSSIEIQSRDTDNTQGVLKVVRVSGMTALALKTQIYVDGELKNKVADGKEISLRLDAGEHVVETKTPGNKGISQNVTISPNREIVFKFKVSAFAKGGHEVLGVEDWDATDDSYTYNDKISIQQSHGMSNPSGRRCPKCGGLMTIQTVSESRKSGCGTCLLYVLLALTILGLLIIIPLALRKKTTTVTYAVCQSCGHREKLS